MTRYEYRAYGLAVCSEIQLPHLPSGGRPPDVYVHHAEVAEHLDKPVACDGLLFEAAPGRFLLRIEGIACYLVRDGSDIRVAACASADPEAVALFLLGSAFGALLMQRGLAPLHASAIHTHRGAVMFAGASGRGKSTVAAAFERRGYDVLADDIAAVETSADAARLVPGYPRLLLWPESMAQRGMPETSARLVRKQIDKYSVPVHSAWRPEPVRIHTVYERNTASADEWSLMPLRSFEKLQALAMHTYRRQYVPGLWTVAPHFDRLGTLARRARVVKVVRPDGGFQIERLLDTLERDFLG